MEKRVEVKAVIEVGSNDDFSYHEFKIAIFNFLEDLKRWMPRSEETGKTDDEGMKKSVLVFVNSVNGVEIADVEDDVFTEEGSERNIITIDGSNLMSIEDDQR